MKRVSEAETGTLNPYIRSGFDGVVSDRKRAALPITRPDRQFQESAFIAKMGGQKAALDSMLTGPSLSSYYPFNSSNVLEGFRVRNPTPFEADVLPPKEPGANAVMPVTRKVQAVSKTLDALGRFEIGILFKEEAAFNSPCPDPLASGGGKIEPLPMAIVNIPTFNYTVYQMQLADFNRNPDEYSRKGPWDYWKKWSFDGMVEFEEMANGAESFQSSGFEGFTQYGRTQAAFGYKMVTMISKGPGYCFNYWGSNIQPGAALYAIFKKQPIPTEYHLTNKRNPAGLTGHYYPQSPVELEGRPREFKPYQMSLVCMPRGGALPQGAVMYYDEQEVLRYDAIVFSLGKVFCTPPDHKFRELTNYYDIQPITKPIPDLDEQARFAYADARQGVNHSSPALMRVIWDCDDGLSL